jgi:hypothetical protein
VSGQTQDVHSLNDQDTVVEMGVDEGLMVEREEADGVDEVDEVDEDGFVMTSLKDVAQDEELHVP